MNRTILSLVLLTTPLLGAAWTDRAEYDLVLNIRAEAAPQKQLALLDQWKAKYPKSELRQIRRELYLSAYHSVADSGHMLDVSREMLADDPKTRWASTGLPCWLPARRTRRLNCGRLEKRLPASCSPISRTPH